MKIVRQFLKPFLISKGTYVPLGRSAKKYYGVPEVYELSKSDGDAVDLKLVQKTKVFTITANGISNSGKNSGETGIRIRIRQFGINDAQHEFETTFSSEGIALLHIPKLIGSTMLVAEIRDNGHTGSRAYNAFMLLRGKGNHPDSLPLTMPKSGNSKSAAKAILAEMNNMFDPDRNGWYSNSSGFDYSFNPNTYIVNLLSEFPHERFPHLKKIALTKDTLQWVVTMEMPYGTGGVFPAKIKLDSTISSYSRWAVELAEPLMSDSGGGWHNPEAVFRMALLCREFPQVCSELPLKNILGFWCRVLPEMPVPLKSEYYGKGRSRVVKDTDPFSIVYAIAALKTGGHIFSDTSLANAIDLLKKSFRTKIDSLNKYYPEHLIDYFNQNDIEKHYFKWINAYGQVGLLTGDAPMYDESMKMLTRAVYDMYKNRDSAISEVYKHTSFFDKTVIVMNLLSHSVEDIQLPYSIFTPYK